MKLQERASSPDPLELAHSPGSLVPHRYKTPRCSGNGPLFPGVYPHRRDPGASRIPDPRRHPYRGGETSPMRGVTTMIQVQGLTKRYGQTTAVEDLTFDVQPDRVTGFLGPNGSGKSTTMRIII